MNQRRPESPLSGAGLAGARLRRRGAVICAVLAAACGVAEGPGAPVSRLDGTEVVQAAISAEARAARYVQIREAAAVRGIDHTAYLLAGIAHAETGLAHCWSEAQWACQGPDAADCGGGPVIAGSGDGPCADRQGGLGMFQFDAGTFDDTLARYGRDVLTVAGNVSHALDYVIHMVMISRYTRNAENEEKALQWLVDFDVNDATLRDQWISTVTRYYNGCQPDWNCWGQRYGSYDGSLQTVLNETGMDFWSVIVVPPDQAPRGQLDAAACEGVRGWAQDADAPADRLDVHLYFGGPAGSGAPALVVRANENRPDLCEPLGDCEHGFELDAPLSLFDGQPHPVHAYGIGAAGGPNAELAGSPSSLQCAADLGTGVRRHVIHPESYGAWRLDAFQDRLPVAVEVVEALATGADVPAAPVLVQSDDGTPEVWLVDGTLRRHVPNPAAMAAWRFDVSTIQRWPAAQVQALTEGSPWRSRPVQVLTNDQAVWLLDDTPPTPETPDAGRGGAGGQGGAGGRDPSDDASLPEPGGAGGQAAAMGGANPAPGDPTKAPSPEAEEPSPEDDAGAYAGLRKAGLRGTPACAMVLGSPGGGAGLTVFVSLAVWLRSRRRRG